MKTDMKGPSEVRSMQEPRVGWWVCTRFWHQGQGAGWTQRAGAPPVGESAIPGPGLSPGRSQSLL